MRVKVATFPAKLECGDADAYRIAEEWGIEFGEVSGVVREATLPSGWTTKSIGNYWSVILDEHGRKRISMFRKLVFWDTDAFARLLHRFETR